MYLLFFSMSLINCLYCCHNLATVTFLLMLTSCCVACHVLSLLRSLAIVSSWLILYHSLLTYYWYLWLWITFFRQSIGFVLYPILSGKKDSVTNFYQKEFYRIIFQHIYYYRLNFKLNILLCQTGLKYYSSHSHVLN